MCFMTKCCRQKPILSLFRIISIRKILATIVVITGCLYWPEPGDLHAQSPDVQALVDQLSSDVFEQREEATAALLKLGDKCLVALSLAEQGSDFEVRERAKAIRERIERNQYETFALKFFRESDPTVSHGLPGWKSFSKFAGASRASKRLFLEMIESRRIIAISLEALDGGKLPAGVFEGLPEDPQQRLASVTLKACADIRKDLSEGKAADLGDALALLTVVATLEEAPLALHHTIEPHFYNGAFRKTMQQPSSRNTVRKLAGQWFLKAPLSFAESVLSISYQYQVPEGADMARRMLNASFSPELSSKALLCLAQFGTVDDLPVIDKYVSDITKLESFDFADDIQVEKSNGPQVPMAPRALGTNRKYERLLCDVALAAGLKITGHDLDEVFPIIVVNETYGIKESSIGFRIDKPAQRQAALNTWREYRSASSPPAS